MALLLTAANGFYRVFRFIIPISLPTAIPNLKKAGKMW